MTKLVRVHLGMVRSDPDYWELRVSERTGTEAIARVMLTPEQFSSLMTGELVTDAEAAND